mmetsp:Transcript_10835/g.21433  ORF Transcript_10835/g.21433 Transcript_10835/m.21433 type:complete len:323 (+) Transcript_10835:79-1047(+)
MLSLLCCLLLHCRDLSALDADEACEGHLGTEIFGGVVEYLRDLALAVIPKQVDLLQQHHLLVPLLNAPSSHLLRDLPRLTALLRLLHIHPLLLLYGCLRNILYPRILWLACRYVHSERVPQLRKSLLVGRLALQPDQHGYLAEPLPHRGVHVPKDPSRTIDLETSSTPHLTVLSHRSHHLLDRRLHADLAGRLRALLERHGLEVGDGDRGGGLCEVQGAHVCDKALKDGVASDKVCLRVDLHHGSAGSARVDEGTDEPVGGAARLLLGGGGDALLPEPLERLLLVPRRILQSSLAVHHGTPRLLAKHLDHRRCDWRPAHPAP